MKTTYLGLFFALAFAVPAIAADNDIRSACESDIKSLCASVQPGGGRIKECIKEHKDALSMDCKKALVEKRNGKAGHGRRNGTGSDGERDADVPKSQLNN